MLLIVLVGVVTLKTDSLQNGGMAFRPSPTVARTRIRLKTSPCSIFQQHRLDCTIATKSVIWPYSARFRYATRLFDTETEIAPATATESILSLTTPPPNLSETVGMVNGARNGDLSSDSQGNGIADATSAVDKLMNGASSSAGLDVPTPTANGGYSHTTASKAKISAANKGKTPWNKGKTRSAETKARIAAGVRAKNRERLLKKLEDMGVTEEEYEAKKAEEKRAKEAEKKSRLTDNGGYIPTAETRKKISDVLKAKYANGKVKRRPIDPSKVRRGFTHSEETRQKISNSLRKRWNTDENYRASQLERSAVCNSREETRRKISETLKRKWQDPVFRKEMVERMANNRRGEIVRDEAYRRKISEAMKKKWTDDAFRSKTMMKIRERSDRLRSERPPKIQSPRPRKSPSSSTASQRMSKTSPRAVPKRSSTQLVTGSEDNDEEDDEDDHGIVMVEAISTASTLKKKRRKRTPKRASSSVVSVEAVSSSTATKVKKKRKSKPTSRATGSKRKQPKTKTNDDGEPDGSINRLRNDRRDLFDLLYGEDDDSTPSRRGNGMAVPASLDGISKADEESFLQSALSKVMQLDDDDLDRFDPYGLDED